VILRLFFKPIFVSNTSPNKIVANMEFTIEEVLDAPASLIYDAWLDSDGHSEMTGGEAECSHETGGLFTAWDGYISGKNLELVPGKVIRQAWRTTEFDANQPDSIVEITFKPVHENKTRITLKHSNLEETDQHYRQGWNEFYFAPMKIYFAEEES
jgi:uncharacterized protein YndB with AHSA1/START domain